MNTQSGNLLVAWYGDDFTGAAAVMEVLTFSGVPSMLFLDVPTPSQLARYPELKAVGVASIARAQSPEWMDENLPAAFGALKALGPEIFHYKICSTLDSSPSVGSIGRAIEIGSKLFNSTLVPILVAAPQMRRYQAFGHLFAGLDDDVFRLDRHPVMANHPVTPMSESDVAKHVAAQSNRLEVSLWSSEDQAVGRKPSRSKKPNCISAFTIDCVDGDGEAAAGRLLWESRVENGFVVGSQGIEYALAQHWIKSGALSERPLPPSVGPATSMVVVSGSVSPTTAAQIAWSKDNGFALIRFDAAQACDNDEALEAEIKRVIGESLGAIKAGLDPLIYTASGPDDPAVAMFRQSVKTSGKNIADVNKAIGVALGKVLNQILVVSGIKRAVVSGGDTSGYATQQLGIFALSALAPTIPGAALFKAHAEGPMDGLELALKGGQMGSADYFGWIRDGGGQR